MITANQPKANDELLIRLRKYWIHFPNNNAIQM